MATPSGSLPLTPTAPAETIHGPRGILLMVMTGLGHRPGMETGAPLTYEYVASRDNFAAVALYAEAFTLGITSVTSTTTCFLVCHDVPPITR